MVWSGGVFTRTDGTATGNSLCVDQANAATGISASRMDGEFNNLTTGVNNCMAKDGTNQATANLNIGNYKLLNVATGTLNGDAVNYAQMLAADNLNVPRNGSRALTGSLNTDGQRIINLPAPVSANDAVRKDYVDSGHATWSPTLAVTAGSLVSQNILHANHQGFMGLEMVFIEFEVRTNAATTIVVPLWNTVLLDQCGVGLAKHVTSQAVQRFFWMTNEANKGQLLIQAVDSSDAAVVWDTTKTYNVSLFFMI